MQPSRELIGTKFLFNENLISYENLVKLFENNGLNTKFIQKPITDNLKVHSLYIKPEFEVSYLAVSGSADEYYNTAGYSCVTFKEVQLYDILQLLGYCDIQSSQAHKQVHIQTETTEQNKSKFITFEYNGGVYSYKKKLIKSIIYFEDLKILHINRTLNEIIDIKLENVDVEMYQYIINQL